MKRRIVEIVLLSLWCSSLFSQQGLETQKRIGRVQVPNWSESDIIKVVRFLHKPKEVPEKVVLSTDEVLEKSTSFTCRTPLAIRLSLALKRGEVSKETLDEIKRLTTPTGQQQTPFKTANFEIHYSLTGDGKVPDQDNVITVDLPDGSTKTTKVASEYDENNAPDYIEKVGIYLEYSLRKFKEFGFNGGDKPSWLKEVYIENLVERRGRAIPPQSWASNRGRIYLDNILDGSETRITVAHELFHHFQYAYDYQEEDWIKEGTARWSEDIIFDLQDVYARDFNSGVIPYLEDPDVDFAGPL